jgi:hypothetical protein
MAGVPRTVGGAAIWSRHDNGELAGRLRALVGVGSMVYLSLGSGGFFVFFCFILCRGRKDDRGLVVLVDTCQHEEAGDPGGNPRGDAQHYPFHNSWSSFKMFDFEQKLYVSYLEMRE